MYTSCLYRYTHIYIYIWARNSIMNYLHGWNQNISGDIFIIFVQKSVFMQTEKIYLIRFTFEMILWFLYILPDEREIYVNLLSRETERERERERWFFWQKNMLESRGKENSQNRTATKSVSSTIFSKIIAFTSSIRSGRSIASRLVKKSNTFSSSIKSPEKAKRMTKEICVNL